MSLSIITTPAEFDAMLDRLPVITDNIDGVPIDKRATELTKEEFAILNAWATKNVFFCQVRLNRALAVHILDAVEVDPKTSQYHFSTGSGKETKYYYCGRNKANRTWRKGSLGQVTKEGLSHDIINSYWGLSDPGIINAIREITSLQHRAIAVVHTADTTGQNVEIPLWLQIGMPPQFTGLIDRNKSRTGADEEFVDRKQFDEQLLLECTEYLEPKDIPKVRQTCSEMLVTVLNNVYCRFTGHDVHANKSLLPSERQRLSLKKCFAGDNGEALERLIAKVYFGSLSEDGKKCLFVKTFSPALVTTALVLASNKNNDSLTQAEVDEFGYDIDIDDELVETTLNLLRESADAGDAAFSPAIAELAKVKANLKKAGGGAPRMPEIMGAFVSAHAQLLESGAITSPVWPNMRERAKNKKAGTYRIYGGYDKGLTEQE